MYVVLCQKMMFSSYRMGCFGVEFRARVAFIADFEQHAVVFKMIVSQNDMLCEPQAMAAYEENT